MAVPTTKATSKPQTGRVVLPSSMVMSAAGTESTKEATLEEDDGVMRFSSWRFGDQGGLYSLEPVGNLSILSHSSPMWVVEDACPCSSQVSQDSGEVRRSMR